MEGLEWWHCGGIVGADCVGRSSEMIKGRIGLVCLTVNKVSSLNYRN